MSPTDLALAALAVPFAGVALIAVAGRHPNLREAVTFGVSITLFLVVFSLGPAVIAGERPAATLFEMLPGLPLRLQVEPLGWLFAMVASTLWVVSAAYSVGYMRANEEGNQTRFYACFAGAIGAAVGIAFAGNMLTLFLFYEALTLVTYPLVTHRGDDEARRGGRVYLGFLLGTSIVFLLPAMIWTWSIAGTLDFRPGGLLAGRLEPAVAPVLLALYMFGIGKAALMPFHRWLPAAMVAPTPVSALLHAVAVVKAGVFTVLKVVVYVFGVDTLAAAGAADWLTAIAAFTIVAASAVALSADNLKRRLAYSTVSQLGYVVLAASLLTPLAIAGGVLHVVTHAFGKITLFFAAGSIYTAAHKTQVSELDGIGRRMPWTMAAFALGSLSMIGLPPLAGFVSKWFILSGAMAMRDWIAVAALTASTLLNAAYFLPIVYRAFLVAPAAGDRGAHGEAPAPMLVAQSLTALAAVALFFFPGPVIALARAVAGG
ncbi:MAG: monovalent cation/H+ antiporter subunit D family protein [Usitatibacter sp.]